MNWGIEDFIIAAVLISGTLFAYKLLSSKTNSSKKRIFIGLALIAVFALIWIELAVGIID